MARTKQTARKSSGGKAPISDGKGGWMQPPPPQRRTMLKKKNKVAKVAEKSMTVAQMNKLQQAALLHKKKAANNSNEDSESSPDELEKQYLHDAQLKARNVARSKNDAKEEQAKATARKKARAVRMMAQYGLEW